MALKPLLEPGRIIHYPVDFGALGGILPHFVILADYRENHYLFFVIRTEPTRWQQKNEEPKKHLVAIDKKNHAFLGHDSWVYCGELHAERARKIEQHIREKPGDAKSKVSDSVRAEILKIVQASKLLTEEQKEGVMNYLA